MTYSFKNITMKLLNQFKKWSSYKEDDAVSPSIKSLISRKAQFKGNSVNLYTIHNTDNVTGVPLEGIVLDNTYYGGSVSQKYDINNKETNIRYDINLTSPKWLRSKLIDFHLMRFNNKCQPFSCPLIVVDAKDISINFTEYTYDISLTKNLPGLQFQGNIDCIKELTNLRYKLRDARNILKNNDVKDILNILQEDSIKELKRIHSTDDAVTMNINLNDFFQLN